jgi:hypothetical protein
MYYTHKKVYARNTYKINKGPLIELKLLKSISIWDSKVIITTSYESDILILSRTIN